MSSFKEEVEKTRQMLENVNRRLTGTDDVVYFRPPIQIRLKKTNPNKSFKLFTSNYKTKTFDKLEYDRKKYIEFVCKHPDCDYDIITVFKVKSKILPENVYIFSGDKNSMPEYIKEIFLEKQEANILRVLYANKYDIISVFNPKMFDTLKKEVDEYNQAEEEKQEKRELEKIEREKRKKSWKYELKKLLDFSLKIFNHVFIFIFSVFTPLCFQTENRRFFRILFCIFENWTIFSCPFFNFH